MDIVRYIETTSATLSDSISRSRSQINLMQEYRTRLIADVVTGKLDVRNEKEQAQRKDDSPES